MAHTSVQGKERKLHIVLVWHCPLPPADELVVFM